LFYYKWGKLELHGLIQDCAVLNILNGAFDPSRQGETLGDLGKYERGKEGKRGNDQ